MSAPGNPYAWTPDIRIKQQGNHWSVKNSAGERVGLFPRGHYPTPTDIKNILALMAKAYDHGFEAGTLETDSKGT